MLIPNQKNIITIKFLKPFLNHSHGLTMKTIITFFLLTLFALTIYGQTNTTICKSLTISGGKILKQGKANLVNVTRGSDYPFLSYDFNQDGKADNISYWLSTSFGQQKILSSFGELLEEEDFYKQDDSEVCAIAVKVLTEKMPLLIIYYTGSSQEDPLESSLYIFKFTNGQFQLSYATKLGYGSYPDNIDFKTMKVEDNYGTGGLFEEYQITFK